MFEWPDASIFEGVANVAERDPTAPALQWQEETTTYGELVAESRRLAAGLAALGAEPGDTIGVWMRNRQAWIEAQLATSALGAALVAVNTRYRIHELEYLLADAGVSIFITETSFLGTDYLDVLASRREGTSEARTSR